MAAAMKDFMSEEEMSENYKNKGKEAAQTPILSLPEIVAGIQSSDGDSQFAATQSCNRMLSHVQSLHSMSANEDVVQSGVLPLLVELLSRCDRPDIQYEAASALEKVASGTFQQIYTVVKADAVAPLIRLLSSEQTNVAEMATWALSNIAADGPDLCAHMLSCGCLEPLLRLVNAETSSMRSVSQTLSNLCLSPPPSEAVCHILSGLTVLICHSDHEVLDHVCLALRFLAREPNNRIRAIIDAGVVPTLVGLLASSDIGVLTSALGAIRQILFTVFSTSDDSQLQVHRVYVFLSETDL